MNKSQKSRPTYITIALVVLAAALAGLYVQERSTSADLRAELRDKSDQLIALNVATDATNGVATTTNATMVDLSTGSVLPASIQISKGATVTWRNGDDTSYTLQSLPGAPESFKSKTLQSADTFSYKFDKPGTYQYFVVEKSDRMTGTIVVSE